MPTATTATTARRLTLAAAVLLTAAAAFLPGCVIAIGDDTIYPGSSYSLVSRGEYKDTIDALASVTVGDDRDLVLQRFEEETVSLVSARDTDTGPIQLYELGAVNKSTRASVSRYLVFYRDRLHAVTDSRGDAEEAILTLTLDD